MKLEMGMFSPISYLSPSDCLIEESRNNNTQWTPEENKIFENALAVYDKDSPDRWHKIADMIPGKTVHDVVKQYRELEDDVNNIEAGLIPIPGYKNKGSAFAFDWDNNCNSFDGFKQSFGFGAKRSSCLGRPADHERKKGVPWTEEEHKLFLMGLKKYGKGDWRNISRNFVVTRTPTQVASHAQKYFIRQLSGGKDKRRASIHDITTVNLNEIISSSPDNKRQASPDQSVAFSRQRNGVAFPGMHFQLDQPNSRAAIAFNSTRGNMVMFSHSINSYELKMQGCTLRRGPVHDSFVGPQSTALQMQSAQYEPY